MAEAAPPPLDERCPRCGGEFHCGMNDAGPCACTTLTLTPALRAELAARYQGCLCLRCLAALAAGEQAELESTRADLELGEPGDQRLELPDHRV